MTLNFPGQAVPWTFVVDQCVRIVFDFIIISVLVYNYRIWKRRSGFVRTIRRRYYVMFFARLINLCEDVDPYSFLFYPPGTGCFFFRTTAFSLDMLVASFTIRHYYLIVQRIRTKGILEGSQKKSKTFMLVKWTGRAMLLLPLCVLIVWSSLLSQELKLHTISPFAGIARLVIGTMLVVFFVWGEYIIWYTMKHLKVQHTSGHRKLRFVRICLFSLVPIAWYDLYVGLNQRGPVKLESAQNYFPANPNGTAIHDGSLFQILTDRDHILLSELNYTFDWSNFFVARILFVAMLLYIIAPVNRARNKSFMNHGAHGAPRQNAMKFALFRSRANTFDSRRSNWKRNQSTTSTFNSKSSVDSSRGRSTTFDGKASVDSGRGRSTTFDGKASVDSDLGSTLPPPTKPQHKKLASVDQDQSRPLPVESALPPPTKPQHKKLAFVNQDQSRPLPVESGEQGGKGGLPPVRSVDQGGGKSGAPPGVVSVSGSRVHDEINIEMSEIGLNDNRESVSVWTGNPLLDAGCDSDQDSGGSDPVSELRNHDDDVNNVANHDNHGPIAVNVVKVSVVRDDDDDVNNGVDVDEEVFGFDGEPISSKMRERSSSIWTANPLNMSDSDSDEDSDSENDLSNVVDAEASPPTPITPTDADKDP